MFDIVKFYFNCISKIIVEIWGSFEIFDGISYGYWVMGIVLFLLVLKVVTFGYGSNGVQNIKTYRSNREKQANKESRSV